MRIALTAVVALPVLTWACIPGNVCSEARQEIAGARCVRSEDCPRPSGEVGVCTQDTGNDGDCVLCAATTAGTAPTQCFLVTQVICP